jgi:hypothetical protein
MTFFTTLQIRDLATTLMDSLEILIGIIEELLSLMYRPTDEAYWFKLFFIISK